jgi:hypothetical protein
MIMALRLSSIPELLIAPPNFSGSQAVLELTPEKRRRKGLLGHTSVEASAEERPLPDAATAKDSRTAPGERENIRDDEWVSKGSHIEYD